MSEADFQMVQAVVSIFTLIVVLAGGVWAYFRFVRQREHALRFEFTVNVVFVGTQGNDWLVEMEALVANKGLVRHDLKNLQFGLKYLDPNDPVVAGGDDINGQIEIPRRGAKGSWFPKWWGHTFIEPGITARYSYVTTIPRAASFANLHGKLFYGDGPDDFHTAGRLVRVPSEQGER
jgi:hypothetical protein